ncbi:MAG: hypothetical protein BWX87_01757 [Bacteroidetes bacterium ADurb.Bin123]|nr:MAG: hypothetical protein BWX87_01757 [Bacteroidetes bacterium ADurb.Bin123]
MSPFNLIFIKVHIFKFFIHEIYVKQGKSACKTALVKKNINSIIKFFHLLSC